MVAAQIAPALEIALEKLRAMGIEPVPGKADTHLLADKSILRDAYEEGRPSEEEACRIGDARFLPAGA